MYEVVIVPGGGINDNFSPKPWVCARLDLAANLYKEGKTKMVMVLSRGTPHKAPPCTKENVPVDEATSSADYLITKYGIDPKHIMLERWSFDTIGNAFASLTMHVLPRNLRKIHIITSDWHLPRTREIFDTVFACGGKFALTYSAVTSLGHSDEDTKIRLDRESESLQTFKTKTKPTLTDMESLHRFIFEDHGCYKAGCHLKPAKQSSSAAMY